MQPITNDKQLLTAILLIYNRGNYQPWYNSFSSDFFDIKNEGDLIKRFVKKKLEILGSNLVTDAMDSNPDEWEKMPQVDIINAIDKYVHGGD